MSLKIVVDTNIIIDHLRNITQAIEGDNFDGLISTQSSEKNSKSTGRQV